MSIDLTQLLNLEPLEKLRIIAALEDSLAPVEPISLTSEQVEELRRRKREHESNPESAIDWGELERFLDQNDD